MKPVWTTEQIMENLPYKLTRAQLNAWHEIERDLCSHTLMSRLVQGDVGSGKNHPVLPCHGPDRGKRLPGSADGAHRGSGKPALRGLYQTYGGTGESPPAIQCF